MQNNTNELEPFNLVDHLAMLLTAVAKAAAKTGNPSAEDVIASDQFAQAHFHAVSVGLKEATGLNAALIEYGPLNGKMKKVIQDDQGNPANWPIWKDLLLEAELASDDSEKAGLKESKCSILQSL